MSWQNCFVDPAFADGAITPGGAAVPPLGGAVVVVGVVGVAGAGVVGAAAPPLLGVVVTAPLDWSVVVP